MISTKYLLIVCLICTCYTSYSQNSSELSNNELKCIKLFNSFTNYLGSNIKNKTEITDSDQLKYILINYLFIDKKLDSGLTYLKENELSNQQLICLKSELKKIYQYFQERENKSLIENLSIVPIRLSSDTFIYNRLTTFQKENTFVFYDRRTPKATLGYVLFIPPIKNIIAESRIWSWTLLFKFGQYQFESATGEVGSEYIFSQ